MSIIHDALKKVQKNRASQPPAAPNPPTPAAAQPAPTPASVKKSSPAISDQTLWFFTGVGLLAVCILIFLFVRSVRQATQSSAASKTTQPFQDGQLVLKGVMTMADKKVALINEEIYEVGESVNGLEVISITSDEVNLRAASGKTFQMDVRNRRALAPKPVTP